MPLVSAGDLVSFGREGVADGCLRSWFSAELSVCLRLSNGATHGREPVGVGGGAGGLPLLGVCSQETSTPCTWSMVAVEFLTGRGVRCVGHSAMAAAAEVEVPRRYQKPVLPVLMIETGLELALG